MPPDDKPLHTNQVSALVYFCSMVKDKIEKLLMKEAKGEKVSRSEFAAKFLNPAAFMKYFDDMKKVETADNPTAWAGVECPVGTP